MPLNFEKVGSWMRKRDLLVSFDYELNVFVIKQIDLNGIGLENITLEKIEAVDGVYNVPLERCDTPGKFIDWLRHLCEKTWVSKDTLDCFIERMLKVAGEKNLNGFVFYDA